MKADLTHVILTLLGITGLVLFILACRPSWSPDGQRVVYSYWDEKSGKSAVVVFDRKTHSSRVVFEWRNDTSSEASYSIPQWTKDGEKILVTIYGKEELQILVLSWNAKKPPQIYTLKKLGGDDSIPAFPYPQVGNTLFLAGEKAFVRLNLETGEILRKEFPEATDCLLYDGADKVLYLRSWEEEKPVAVDSKDTGEKKPQENRPQGWELGELDQKDLSLHPTLKLKPEELEARGIPGFEGLLDVDPKTQKFAIAEDSDGTKAPRIVVIGKNGIERVLDVGIKERPYELGNLQWSRDGQTIFANALIQDEKSKTAEFVLVEVSVDGKGIRIDPIEQGSKEQFGDGYLFAAQIALSPDGRLIAVPKENVNEKKQGPPGLYLLDLSRTDRRVNFYPAPALAGQKQE